MLNIERAEDRDVTIREPLSHKQDALKNELWYRGDPSELDQFFKNTANDEVSKSRFWASVPSKKNTIRKFHSGLPSEIIDKLTDIVVADVDSIEIDNEEMQLEWDDINKDNKFTQKVLATAIRKALITGDGVFKLSTDREVSEYPLIEFYDATAVEYIVKRGRTLGYKFSSYHKHDKKNYRLEETYKENAITYNLYSIDDKEKEVPLSTVPELAELKDIVFVGDYIMAIPLKFFDSPKWEGRGDSILSRKTDTFDSLDEVISQWIDAIRDGRVKNYIPESLLPKDEHTGETLDSNPFDNRFIKKGMDMTESAVNQIEQIQAEIHYNAFVESYSSMVDMALQGIISPATLGIDLKKTDNAEAQREKEKTTLYTRGKLIDVLSEVLPTLVDITLKTYYNLLEKTPVDIEQDITINFGEYASPDFDSKVDVVGKAKGFGIMSLEQSIEELYGDTWTDEQKQEEIERIRSGGGVFDIPATGVDGFEHEEERNFTALEDLEDDTDEL